MCDFFKVGLSPSKKKFFIGFKESTLKMMKNAFHLILKVLFVLKMFYFFSWPFDNVEKNPLIKKWSSSKIMSLAK